MSVRDSHHATSANRRHRRRLDLRSSPFAEPGDGAIHGVAQRLLAWIVDQPEIQLVHDVRIAELRVGVGEAEGATRTRPAERSATGTERDARPGPDEAEGEA